MIILLLLLLSTPGFHSQNDTCEPAVDPSPSCLCTRLDFMDTYSFRLRFGNSTFAGSNYKVTPPSFTSNYDCVSEQLLQCTPTSSDKKTSAFAVFNMKYILELSDRVPSVFCYPSIRMFDMQRGLVQQYQANGELPTDDLDLHLTEVGCIEYGGSNDGEVTLPGTRPTTMATEVPGDCTCSRPPPIMTQPIFDMQFAFNFPKTKFKFGVPKYDYTIGCQHVSMFCPSGMKALMFFNDQYILNGNDILDIASKYNLHCNSTSVRWMFDESSNQKFKSLLGINTIDLSYLGCAKIIS
ncbi:hypothetical protein CAEBREN_23617 [Caenorhabditis brenneri]|uniref:Uncharacterized protein n=1 Tax=Caenorhabditis brenneri TaxID=135651 RepID=G0PIA1_CAEBE|nr:hypothetical protein CAEBREN_23617 [Caenorhabditis brenneri]